MRIGRCETDNPIVLIRLALAHNVAFNIAKETTTQGFIVTLSNIYKKPSVSNKVYLIRRLFTLQIGEGASIADHLNEFNIAITQLS